MKKCELLAPAGGKEQYIAAVENGADAIYLGGQMMNARMSAENFDLCEMEKAVDFGHLRDVKTFVTMNTLVSNDELARGVEYAYSLYKMGVDGLIIQDLGLGLAIRENLPEMPLHLSTQATVYNRLGVEAAMELGYDRVVLARELSIDEIRDCCKPSLIDIEVFAHGALCFCYSGQCQLSRSIGGRSANRGACAQPCRLPYSGRCKASKGKVSGYLLSPKDLCSVDFLDELMAAGVSSLKIEGRMKSPEYVATVVRIYRKYLDLLYEHGTYTVNEDDRRELLQIFNRGGFTSSYLQGEYKKNILTGDIPKHQGLFTGTIIGANQRGNIGTLSMAKGAAFQKGDIFEIHPAVKTDHERKPISGTVTFLEEGGKGKVLFGDIKGLANSGDRVYRIISSKQIGRARDTFKNVDYEEGKFMRKRKVKAVFDAAVGGHMNLSLETADGQFKAQTSDGEYEIEESKGITIDENLISEKLCKTGNTPFQVVDITCNISPNAYIPPSRLNQLRRDAFELLGTKIKERYKRQEDGKFGIGHQSALDRIKSKEGAMVELYFYHVEDLFDWEIRDAIKEISGRCKKKLRVLIPLGEVLADNSHDLWERIKSTSKDLEMEVMFYLEHISKGYLDKLIIKNFDRAVELVRASGNKIYIGNMGWLVPFKNKGVEVYGDFGLNICNDASLKAYGRLGVSKWVSSLEFDSCHKGAMPLMTIEYPLDFENIIDRREAKYSLTKLGASGKTILKKALPKLSAENMWKMIGDCEKTDNEGHIRIYY